ncbi:nitroreductase family deazaflavin-dependent oxidoreductase [Micromonospora phytophila]|nr:nitroreductase/quinone reductase family protein [Micromonospora phytophila]MCM0675304.1 nitroreductase family deazaflavin-dependent oxidoreductase [Micromonospora phytophila]
MPNDFNQQIVDEFRANAGRVGGPFEGARLILLTTTGARTGAPHTTPVGYLPDGGERILVIASAGGRSIRTGSTTCWPTRGPPSRTGSSRTGRGPRC